MITIEQCRAARGLLDWTQQDLANQAGLSKTAINNFEKGYSDIKRESLRAIRTAFESADIEFIEKNGLRKKDETAKILKGKTAFPILFADLEKSVENGHEILISAMDQRFTENYGPGKMNALFERCREYGIPLRILPAKANQPGIVTFLYGRDKIAFLLWGRSVIVMIDSPEAAEAERQHFEYLWDISHGDALNKKGGTV